MSGTERGKGRGHALELDVDEGDFAARRKAVGLAEFLAAHGLLRARRGSICGRSSAAASLCSPTVVCLQQVAAGLHGEPRVTTISIHASIAQPFFCVSSWWCEVARAQVKNSQYIWRITCNPRIFRIYAI